MIDVENKVRVYEINGKDKLSIEGQPIGVLSHWNSPERVESGNPDRRQAK